MGCIQSHNIWQIIPWVARRDFEKVDSEYKPAPTRRNSYATYWKCFIDFATYKLYYRRQFFKPLRRWRLVPKICVESERGWKMSNKRTLVRTEVKSYN